MRRINEETGREEVLVTFGHGTDCHPISEPCWVDADDYDNPPMDWTSRCIECNGDEC